MNNYKYQMLKLRRSWQKQIIIEENTEAKFVINMQVVKSVFY